LNARTDAPGAGKVSLLVSHGRLDESIANVKSSIVSVRFMVSGECHLKVILKSAISIVLVVLMVGALTPVVSAGGKPSLPASHMIANIPFHAQLNGLSCGAGSLEMVFDYWGPDIDQKEIMNVARTSSDGTWTPDIARTGQFSSLSSAMGNFFPNVGPSAGFVERGLGYAAFGFSSERFWLPELKALIANDIPVIVLMNYYPTGGGGHYRVVMGYDDSQGLVYFIDTWGRDTLHLNDWTGILPWTYADFQSGWNYAEYGTAHPYFGVVVMPWTVDLSVKGKQTAGSTFTVTASITYPCPKPFDSTLFPASDAFAGISLPTGMTLVGAPARALLGTMVAGTTSTVTWTVHSDQNCHGSVISVTAGGLVSGHVPDAWWTGQMNYYPAYDYTDIIGGVGSLTV
jgi:hypothetical protein